MEEDIEDFRKELRATIQDEQATNGTFGDESFFSIACSILEDCEAIDEFVESPCNYAANGKEQVFISGYDPSSFDTDESITLIAVDPDCLLRLGAPLQTINTQECEKHFKAMLRFAGRALTGRILDEIEESTDAYDLASRIHENKDNIIRFRLHFLTDRLYTGRGEIDSDERKEVKDSYTSAGKHRNYLIEKHIWDISRLQKTKTTMMTDENFFLDFGEPGIPAVESDTSNEVMRLYLMFIPATYLAEAYRKYGSKLMEANVRSFLSLRGKINKGINNTLKDQPDNFVAFNNGITATATDITQSDDGHITRADNLQIVNGGQTTATIFYSQMKSPRPDLSNVRVPVKLIVVDKASAQELIPQISRFSNSQNKVDEADFSANNPYQVTLEKLSKRVFAPMPNGTQTHWFYERMRGQYDNEKNQKSGKEARAFTKLNPKNQVIKMVEGAKYQMCWNQKPYIASLGNQKCFAQFVKQQQATTDANTDWSKTLTEDDYKQLACEACMYRSLYKLVKQADWFEGSYCVNIVEYAISKLSYDLQAAGVLFNFKEMWLRQGLSKEESSSLLQAAHQANDVILDENRPVKNASEWAKKEDCWKLLKKYPSCLPFRYQGVGIGSTSAKVDSEPGPAPTEAESETRIPHDLEQTQTQENQTEIEPPAISDNPRHVDESSTNNAPDNSNETVPDELNNTRREDSPASAVETSQTDHEAEKNSSYAIRLSSALQHPAEIPFRFTIPDLPDF